jgi:hypothetical protein
VTCNCKIPGGYEEDVHKLRTSSHSPLFEELASTKMDLCGTVDLNNKGKPYIKTDMG